MAFTNGTVKVRMEFVTAGGSYSDATNIQLKIYSLTNVLIDTISILEADKVSTGIYEKDYTVPVGYTEVIAEVVGTVGTATITGLVEIDTQLVDSVNLSEFLPQIKSLLQIATSDTSKDGYLTTIIPFLVDFIQTYCKQDFKNAAGQIELPLGVKLVLAKLCQYHMKDPTTSDETFQGFATKISTDYPKSIIKTLDSYKSRKIVFN